MGATAVYRCPRCGYVTDEIDEGPGLFSPVAYKAFVCQDCLRVVGKQTDGNWNLREDDRECSYCHGTNLVPWEDGRCPRCHAEMQWVCVGLWD